MNAETPSPPRLRGHSCEAAAARNAPIALWRIAQAFMQLLFNLFGEPQHVARNSVIAARAHRELASWLACAEAMLRRLLLIEAAALPKPTPRQRIRAPRERIRRPHEFWPDKPEDWRVSFRCFSSNVGARGLRPRISSAVHAPPEASRSMPRTFRDAWPLALRYEALLRVYNNPAPAARRLAHRLHARPHGASALFHAPPSAEHRIEDFTTLTQAAAQARDRVCDSS